MAQALVMDWVRKLGYESDPFVDEILQPVAKVIVGLERPRERINLFLLKDGSFGIVKGDVGVGKTILLRWVEEQIELHASSLQSVLVEEQESLADPETLFRWLFRSQLNVYEKFVRRLPERLSRSEQEAYFAEKASRQRLVILVDNAQLLAPKSFELLARLLARAKGVRLVLAGEQRALAKLPIKGLNDELKIELAKPSSAELVAMVEQRLAFVGANGTFPFDRKRLHALADRAKGEPRKMLELCREEAMRLALRIDEVMPAKQAKQPPPSEEQVLTDAPAKDEGKASSEGGGLFKIRFAEEKEIPQSIVPHPEPLEEEGVSSDIYEPFEKEESRRDAQMLTQLVSSRPSTNSQEKVVEDDGPEPEQRPHKKAALDDEVAAILGIKQKEDSQPKGGASKSSKSSRRSSSRQAVERASTRKASKRSKKSEVVATRRRRRR